MAERELVVLMTHGADHELSSVAWTVACGGITAGMRVYAFLTSAAVDIVRKGALETVHVAPMDPLKRLVDDFIGRGGTVWACPPCVKARGYGAETFIDGVQIQGASGVHEKLRTGAASLSF